MTDVDIERLKAAATSFAHYADAFHTTAMPAVDKCQIPASSFPPISGDFGAQYAAAWQELDLSIRAMPELLGTIGRALDQVARHYERQDDSNATAFTAPDMPAPRAMAGSGAVPTDPAQYAIWAVTGAATGWGDLKMLKSFGTMLRMAKDLSVVLPASAVPYGLELIPLVIAADLFVVYNLRDPLPYFSAGDGWGDIEKILNAAVADLPRLAYDVVYKDPKWTGPGADSFYAFMNDDLDRTLAAMMGLNNAMELACTEAAFSIAFAIISYIGVSLTTGTICNLAKFVPDPTQATQISITHTALVMFMEYAGLILVDLGEMFLFTKLAAIQIRQASDTLRAYLTDKDGKLDGGALRLSTQDMQHIGAWEDWVRKS